MQLPSVAKSKNYRRRFNVNGDLSAWVSAVSVIMRQVAFTHACKGNFGSNRNCSANYVVAPGLKTSYGGGSAHDGAPCGEETNNGHGSTFANKYFERNTCIYLSKTASPYLFASCDTRLSGNGPNLNGTVWHTSANKFLIPTGGTVEVSCHGQRIGLTEWNGKYRQDPGATIGTTPPATAVLAAAKGVLGL